MKLLLICMLVFQEKLCFDEWDAIYIYVCVCVCVCVCGMRFVVDVAIEDSN